MKILKIEDENGYFLVDESAEWQPIDSIDKNDLLKLLDKFLEETVEMDSPQETSLGNQAHSIIYSAIYEKLMQLSQDKNRFKDESERLYLEEINRYSKQETSKPNPLD
jgi:hypothetical protein